MSEAKKKRKARNVAEGTRSIALESGAEASGYSLAVSGAVDSLALEAARNEAIDARFDSARERFADSPLVLSSLDEARRSLHREDALTAKEEKSARAFAEKRAEELRAEYVEKGMSESESDARARVYATPPRFFQPTPSVLRALIRGEKRACADGVARFFLLSEVSEGADFARALSVKAFPMVVESEGAFYSVCQYCLEIGDKCVHALARGALLDEIVEKGSKKKYFVQTEDGGQTGLTDVGFQAALDVCDALEADSGADMGEFGGDDVAGLLAVFVRIAIEKEEKESLAEFLNGAGWRETLSRMEKASAALDSRFDGRTRRARAARQESEGKERRWRTMLSARK